ncbi:hypothetical protein LWI29_013964 [Acer saccharum]|uniref:Uncharacterized protein n=1 Tax=Acer saccharum TaxID=4024 RepID=A0AA39RD10_ACESA|nr:hypothetical protein LWI29_013964 [Acer saccharum]
MEDYYLGTYSDSGSIRSEDFDDDFVEPEYQQEEEPEVVEHNDAFVVDGEEHNEQENYGSKNDQSQFDDEHRATLNELRKLDRKRDLKKTKVYTKALKPSGNFNFGDFMGKVRKDYILAPFRSQVYRAKNKAGEMIQGSLYAQYGKLRDYAEELKRSNLGSTVVIDTELGENE